MNLDIAVSRNLVSLRSMQIKDASWIISLRTDPENAKYINPTSLDIGKQEDWLTKYRERADDFYFGVFIGDEPVGTIAVYDINFSLKFAEWGRWIVKKTPPVSVISALLLLDFSFFVLNLDVLYSRTMSENKKVVDFHNSYGAEILSAKAYEELTGLPYSPEFTIHAIRREQYPEIRKKLEKYASMAERILSNSQASHS